MSETKRAYETIVRKPFILSKTVMQAKKWNPDQIPKISADTLIEVADAARRRETFELEDNVPVCVLCLAEPRIIDTPKGAWNVVDIALPDGTEHLLNLGRTVLKKKVFEKMPLTNKRLIIMSLGKPRGKAYFDYVVMTVEEYEAMQARKDKKA